MRTVINRSMTFARRRPGAVGAPVALFVVALAAGVTPSQAALVIGDFASAIIIGSDDDNSSNPLIQPPGTVANQSLNNTDILVGGDGNDVIVGLLGSDVIAGGGGNDIIIGGPEQGTTPNSDVMFGDAGDDINIWAPGDGSEVFIGGAGTDAIVFGVIDKDASNRPISGGPAPGFAHIPRANVTGQGGFCTIERVNPATGYEFLAKFFGRAAGNLIVTVRLREVEQFFCTSEAGGQITYADLRQANPQLEVVTLPLVLQINNTVGRIIR